MKLPHATAAATSPLARSAIAVAAGWASLALLASAVALARQTMTGPLQGDMAGGLLDALALAALSFGFRFLRWHRLATRLAPGLPLASSLRIQAIGFALSATPGRLGELLKLHLLAEQTGVTAGRGGSIVLVEKLTEALTFAAIAAIGGLLLSATGGPGLAGMVSVAALGVAAAVLILGRRFGPLSRQDSFIPRRGPNPLGPPSLQGRGKGSVLQGGLRSRFSGLLAELGDGSQQLVRPGPLAEAFFLCVAARICDSLALAVVAGSLGAPITPAVGLLALGAAGAAGGLSMLPGGVGAAEATMSGVLLATGLDGSTALSATLIVRSIVYWLWVGIGLVLAVQVIRGRRGEAA